MDHNEFINYIAESFECSKETAATVVKVFAEGVSLAMSEGYNINIQNLGKFSIATVPAHKVRLPKVGKLVTVKQYHRPYFTPAKDLKDCCTF